MTSSLVDERLSAIVEQALSGATKMIAVTPTEECIETVIDVAMRHEQQLPEIRLLAEQRTLKEVMDDFVVASHAAELVDEGILSVRGRDEAIGNNLVVTEQRVVTIVDTTSQYAGLVGEDDALVNATVETYENRWQQASSYTIRVPPISEVQRTLAEEVGTAVKQDFLSMLERLDALRDSQEDVDEVTLSLLAAAKNEELLYDISKWGEDVGIASKATFSRTKTELEDTDLIETEKVPIDIGRPRLRLKLGEAAASNDEGLVTQARTQLG